MNSNERDRAIIERIIQYCDELVETRRFFGDSYTTFSTNAIYRNAAALCILQIGELAGYLSQELRSAYNDVPWRSIKDMRNMIAHKYGNMSAEVMWETITEDVPTLRDYCLHILKYL